MLRSHAEVGLDDARVLVEVLHVVELAAARARLVHHNVARLIDVRVAGVLLARALVRVGRELPQQERRVTRAQRRRKARVGRLRCERVRARRGRGGGERRARAERVALAEAQAAQLRLVHEHARVAAQRLALLSRGLLGPIAFVLVRETQDARLQLRTRSLATLCANLLACTHRIGAKTNTHLLSSKTTYKTNLQYSYE